AISDCGWSSTVIVRSSPARSCTDRLAGSRPSLMTTISTGPGATATDATPRSSVCTDVPLNTTDAPATATPALRTSTRMAAFCGAARAFSAPTTMTRRTTDHAFIEHASTHHN